MNDRMACRANPLDSSQISDPYGRRSACAWKLSTHNVHTEASYDFGPIQCPQTIVHGSYRCPYGPGDLLGPLSSVRTSHGPKRPPLLILQVFSNGIRTGQHGTCICTSRNSKGYTYGFLKTGGLNVVKTRLEPIKRMWPQHRTSMIS